MNKATHYIHYFEIGIIERYSHKRGWWIPGYSEVTSTGITFPWLGKRDAQHDARNRGGRAVFHATEGDARAAIAKTTGN